MGLSALVTGYIQAQQHKQQQAQDLATQQFKQSEMALRTQQAQMDAQRLDQELKQQQVQNALAQRKTDIDEANKQSLDTKRKADVEKDKLNEVGRNHRAAVRGMIQAGRLNLSDRQHVERIQTGFQKTYELQGVPQAEAIRRAKTDIEALRYGVSDENIDYLPLISSLAGIKPTEGQPAQPTAPQQPSPTIQGIPYLDAQAPQQQPQAQAPNLLNALPGIFEKNGLGDERGLPLPKVKAQIQNLEKMAEEHVARKNDLIANLTSRKVLNELRGQQKKTSAAMEKAYLETVKDKSFLTPLTAVEVIARTHELNARTNKLTQDTKEAAESLKGVTSYAELVTNTLQNGNAKAITSILEDSSTRLGRARTEIDKYNKEKGVAEGEVRRMDYHLNIPDEDPLTHVPAQPGSDLYKTWETAKVKIYAPARLAAQQRADDLTKSIADATKAINDIEAAKLEAKKKVLTTDTGTPDNKATNAAAKGHRDISAGAQKTLKRTTPKAVPAPHIKTFDRATGTFK